MTKKKFKVWAKYETYCYVDVEAETKEEANDIVDEMDGGDFQQRREDAIDDDGGWDIVTSMTEEVEE